MTTAVSDEFLVQDEGPGRVPPLRRDARGSGLRLR